MSKSWWCKFKIKKIEQGAILKRQYWSQRHEQNWHGLPQLQWLAWLLVQDNVLLCACASTCLVKVNVDHIPTSLSLSTVIGYFHSSHILTSNSSSSSEPVLPPPTPAPSTLIPPNILPSSWSSKCKYVIIPYRLGVRLYQRHAFKVSTSYIITM